MYFRVVTNVVTSCGRCLVYKLLELVAIDSIVFLVACINFAYDRYVE